MRSGEARSGGAGRRCARHVALSAAVQRLPLGQRAGQRCRRTTNIIPIEPPTIRDAGLTDSEVESLILKYLLSRGDCTGREVSDQIKLPFILLDPLLRQLKFDQLLVYRGSAPMNDYVYQLTDLGRERARRFMDHCTYFGSAPGLADRLHRRRQGPVARQAASHRPKTCKRAFATSWSASGCCAASARRSTPAAACSCTARRATARRRIAERITRAFGQFIWIPRAIGVDGEIIRLFDPVQPRGMPAAGERRACSTSRRSTAAGSASAGRRSSSAAN